MITDTFWQIIGRAGQNMDADGSIAKSLQAELVQYSLDDIVMFGKLFDEYHEMANRWLLWSAGNLFTGGFSDDGFHYFRSWLVGRGKDTYERVLENPDVLAYYDKLGNFYDPGLAGASQQLAQCRASVDNTIWTDDETAKYAAACAYEQKCALDDLNQHPDYNSAYRQMLLHPDIVQYIRDSVKCHPNINCRIESESQAEELLPHCKAAFAREGYQYNLWSHPVEKCDLEYEHPPQAAPDGQNTHTLKFYYPATVSVYEQDEYGHTPDYPDELPDSMVVPYLSDILARCKQEELPAEKERGLMAYYHEDDGVNSKVRSAQPTVEVIGRKLYGVAICEVSGDLTPAEETLFKEYWSGQMSDGYGEGVEQRPIRGYDGTDIYVSFWSPDNDWRILSEPEMLAPPQQTPDVQMGGLSM